MDTTDGVAMPFMQHDNNNRKTSDDSMKHTNMYLENNIPMSACDVATASLSVNDVKRSLKSKSLAEAIETLKQNAVPMSSTMAISNGDLDTVHASGHTTGRLSFSKHTSVIQGATDNSIGLPYSLISCDIICNCDGTVYLSPSDLSCKLLTLEGVLNEMSDAQCSPFPVQAKSVKYCPDNVQNSRSVLCYTVTPNPSVEPTSTRLVACLVCRYKFDHTDQLFTHGTVIHNLTFDFQQNCSNSSAIIQQVRSKQPTLAFLTFDQRMSTELLISRNEETIAASGSRRPSVSTPPTPASKLVSGLHGTNSVGCEDHPDGGIECPKCDLILSSTRSLGGKRYIMANIKW